MFPTKIFFITLCLLSLPVIAEIKEKAVKNFVQKQYFQSRNTPLIISADKNIPFSGSGLYRVRDLSSHRGWTVWADEKGNVVESKKTNLKNFLRSLAPGFVKMKFTKSGKDEAQRISQALLDHLGTSRRQVNCHEENERILCDLTLLEDPFAGEKATLKFGFKEGFILPI